MSNAPPPYAGGCACGAVRFIISEPAIGARICHCRQCQTAMASPFLAQGSFPSRSVKLEGRTEYFHSSARLRRHFCPQCGVRVLIEPLDMPERLAVHLATLDDPSAVRPEMHIWLSDKIAWDIIGDNLPQYPQGSPEPYRPIPPL